MRRTSVTTWPIIKLRYERPSTEDNNNLSPPIGAKTAAQCGSVGQHELFLISLHWFSTRLTLYSLCYRSRINRSRQFVDCNTLCRLCECIKHCVVWKKRGETDQIYGCQFNNATHHPGHCSTYKLTIVRVTSRSRNISRLKLIQAFYFNAEQL